MSIFKAYDIRGTYPDQLNEETAYKIGRAFVSFLKCKNAVIGRDMRLSSPALFKALTKGITEQGANVIDIGIATTPMMYFSVAHYGFDAGISITASHNPKEYNGFKLVGKKAVPVSGETGIAEIKRLVEKNDFNESAKKGKITKKEVLKDYVKHTLKFVDVKKIKSFRIVVDAGNATASVVVPELFKHTKCEIIPLYFELDGTFPNHAPNPLESKNLVDLQKKIMAEKADLGIACDGDVDRLFFVDEKGQPVPAEFITALMAKILLSKKPNEKILYDVRSSWIVKEEIEKNKGKAGMCRVGHSLIKSQMRKENALFAGEVSAHYFMRDNYFFEAPFIVTLNILKLLSDENKTLSALIAPLKRYYKIEETNFVVKDKTAKMKELEKLFSDGKISHLDGIRIDYDDWWFNVRPSNTEPLLRLNLEAKTKQKMEEMAKKIADIIRH